MTLDTQTSLINYLWNLMTGNAALKAAMGGTVRCYLARAKPDAPFPYIVHRIDIAASDPFPMRQATYILDVWSESDNASEILAIRTIILGLLDELIFTTDEVNSARLWIQADSFVPEIEQDFYHYVMQWNLRYYGVAETAAILDR